MKNARIASDVAYRLGSQTYLSASSCIFITLTLGGDHHIAIGSIAGIARGEVKLQMKSIYMNI